MVELFGELEPTDPAYRDRDIRLKVMDDQRIDGALFFPTLGVGMEEALRDDLPAARAAFRAFNRWLDDDWGFHYKERIFAAPYLTLSDVDETVAELEWVLDRGARIVIFQYGPVRTPEGFKSPGDPGVRSDLGAHRGGGHRRRLPRRRQRLQLDPRQCGAKAARRRRSDSA